MTYFIIKDNQQQGPYSVYELKDMNLSSDTLVWAEGMTDWTPAWKVQELHDCLYADSTCTPPPVPPQAAQPAAGQGMPQQPAAPYQAPQQPAASTEPQRKSNALLWVIGVAVLLLLLMGFTRPDRSDHRKALKAYVVKQHDTDVSTGDKFFDMALKMVNRFVNSNEAGLSECIDSTIHYHSYLIFSTTTFDNRGTEERSSLGLLGHVFTANEDDFMEALGRQEHVTIEESSSMTDSAPDEAAEDDESDSSSQQGDLQMDAKTKQAAKQIVNSAADMVKDEVKQDGDSITTNGVGKIIDEVADFLKSLF